jgi:hypothetical protein
LAFTPTEQAALLLHKAGLKKACEFSIPFRLLRLVLGATKCLASSNSTHLEKANALSQVLNLSPGNRARILFALSVALQEVGKRRDEAPRLKLEVAKFRKAALRKVQGEMPNDETFEAFDLLVRILDR